DGVQSGRHDQARGADRARGERAAARISPAPCQARGDEIRQFDQTSSSARARHGPGLFFPATSRQSATMEKGGWVYIMANRYRGGMYVGVASDLPRRVWQHREGQGSQHVAETGKTRLVYAERHEEIEAAIAREKL